MDGIQVIACDIFGTTVDWYTGVTRQVREILRVEDPGAFASEWRAMYQPSMARVRDGEREWTHLDTLHRESLDELVARHGVDVGVADRERLVRAWHRLPAWPDSVSGLARLSLHYTLAALSNGGFALLTNLVKAAGLPFDCVLSAELARAYKPDAAVYRKAAELLDVHPREVLMVAAHTWDIDGAREAGMRTAFLVRPGEKGPHQEADRKADADLTVSSFTELADVLSPA
ncbi:MAG TPA: haloacid dehalogenase type II [Actinophytocola sp.]|nr:haloacid dehalogenase type II [Actinophytocola sp.]